MYIYFFLWFLFLFQNPLLFSSQELNKEGQNLSNQLINPLAYYRIDSLYNGYSITANNEDISLNFHKKGDSQNFIFKQFNFNSYYIECRLNNKRLGINGNNEVVAYDKNDIKNNEKMLWIIKSFDLDNNINNNN